jgi:hypothetical protein
MAFSLNGTTREAAAAGHSRKVIPAELASFYRPVADKVRDLQAQGLKLPAIARELKRLAIRTRTGKLTWPQVVAGAPADGTPK